MNHGEAVRGMGLLGVHPAHIQNLQRLPYEQAQATLEKLKVEAKKRYRKLALELHPDRTGGDEDKATLFRIVTEVNNQIQAITLRQKLQRPVQRRVIIQTVYMQQQPQTVRVQRQTRPFQAFSNGVSATTNTTTTNTGNNRYNARKVAFMRGF